MTVESGVTYPLSGDVKILDKRHIEARYQVEGHPDISAVTVESPSRGMDAWVTVENVDRSTRFESFTFAR